MNTTVKRLHYYASDDSTRTNATATYGLSSSTATLTFTPEDNSTYYIVATCLFGSNSTTTTRQAKCRLQRTSGVAATLAENVCQMTVASEWITFVGMSVESYGVAPGAQTYQIEIANGGVSTTSAKNYRLIALKQGSGEFTSVQTTRQTTTSASYADIPNVTSLSLSPGSDTIYMIFAACQLDASITGLGGGCLLRVGANLYQEALVCGLSQTTNNFWPYGVIRAIVAPGGVTTTVNLQTKIQSGTFGAKNVVLLAIPAITGFINIDENDVTANATNATNVYTDYLSQASTTAAGAYWIVACGFQQNTTTAGLNNFMELVEDSTVVGSEAVWAQSTTTEFKNNFFFYRKVMDDASHTWHLKFKSATGTLTQNQSSIAIMQLDFVTPDSWQPGIEQPYLDRVGIASY